MKQLANVEYIAGDIEINDDGDLTKSLDNLKIVVDQVAVVVDADNVTQPEQLETNGNNTNGHSNEHEKCNKNKSVIVSIPETKQTIKKKLRQISTDSGFGSFGRSDSYATTSSSNDSILTNTSILHVKKTVVKAASSETLTTHSEFQEDTGHSNEKLDKLTPLNDTAGSATMEVRKTSAQRDEKIKDFQKVRNTTLDDVSNGYELDAKLINRCDGFSEVQCYFDENGSPKVREKSRRKKATLKQTIKARSLGASMENGALRPPKTPSCVSFSRICKKFKETFCSKFSLFQFSFFFLIE